MDFSVGSKRRHSDDSCQDGSSRFGEVPKSEVWSLRDVIFTDHVTNVKVGSVVKLDGNYVAVHYPALSPDELSTANLDNCRLLRKDELVVHIEFMYKCNMEKSSILRLLSNNYYFCIVYGAISWSQLLIQENFSLHVSCLCMLSK